MNLKELQDIDSTREIADGFAVKFKALAAEAAQLASPAEKVHATITGAEVKLGWGDAGELATGELLMALNDAWPGICRQTELKLLAVSRMHANKAEMAQRQLDAFLYEPTDTGAAPEEGSHPTLQDH